MISIATLKYLAAQKYKDALVLFMNGRNGGAVYLMGYAVELALKRSISLTLGFANGFPETGSEFAAYSLQLSQSTIIERGVYPTQINQIRNHRLNDLLIFSGEERKIVNSYAGEWEIVRYWDPGKRYIRQRISFKAALDFLTAATQILKAIG